MTRPTTTAAMQTPPGRGGIAVIALTGPEAQRVLEQAFRPWSTGAGRDAAASGDRLLLGRLVDGEGVIDEAIVAWRGGQAEINIHGGPAAARAALALLARLGAAVVPAPAAAPGSFPAAHPKWGNPAIGAELLEAMPLARSRRVMAALTQQWSGGISRIARRAVERCGESADEGLADAFREAAERLPLMRRLLDPPEVVLAGPPNAGKSTLANALVGREVSIVHEQAGTTRDWVREPALLDGVPIWLTDTAGLWQADDDVDAEAVRRAHQQIRRANLVLLLGAGRPSTVPDWLLETSPDALQEPPLLHVAAKCDLHPPFDNADAAVCAPTGEGLDELKQVVLQSLGLRTLDPAAPAAFTQRQADLLRAAARAYEAASLPDATEALTDLLGTTKNLSSPPGCPGARE